MSAGRGVASAGEARRSRCAEAQAVLAAGASTRAPRALADWRRRRSTTASSSATSGDARAVLELGLQTGRIRALYGPGGEQAALRLYRRLPRGAEVAETAAEVNEALARARRAASWTQSSSERSAPAPSPLTVRPAARSSSVHLDRAGRAHPERGRDDRQALLHGLPRPRGPALPRRRRRRGRAREGAGPPRLPARPSPSSRRRSSRELQRASGPVAAPALPAATTSTACSSSSPRPRRARSTAGSTRDAEARSLLCNVADVPELCSFILPAVHRAGPDRRRSLDRRRLAGAREAAARRVRRADRRPARRARPPAARAAARG